MTPHRSWLRHYTPLIMPIRLANNSVIYSAGVGSMVFAPEVEGDFLQHVEFSRVLHVPDLGSNLLSVLYLTRHHRFNVHIVRDRMSFILDGQTRFIAPIDDSNTAHLAGTVIPAPESALVASSSTLPLNETLWHRRFAHFHHSGVKSIISEGLVTGMDLVSSSVPDPICEPCLCGKLNAAPFPSSPSRADRPLALVHSDVHGPLPVRTASGYRYWSTWIDDQTRYRVVIPLKSKDETFAAFQQYKAHAETTLGLKIGALQDDKGGEYMSNAFEAFCTTHGISRRHTVRNRPQQNGVAERFNRVLVEGITAMLAEAGLPNSFWGEALASLVHVLNRTPTSTPHPPRHGAGPSQMSPTCGSRVAWLMCMCRRTNAELWAHTWSVASSLATLLATRAGNSTIQTPSVLSSLNALCSMRGTSLASRAGLLCL